ncbi:vascular endothelial growth factor receptor 1 isoform X2 [Solea senegalensis]|uniref:Platelet-derived growth factor receptor-like protein n=1 Tax=Solea senegalensis TaxID=28829 RepID=A0AAV6PFV4_SOLSE|nr:vascular endothelial growth factor receptor 1 isoform X2 [Solea senegalensis]
MLSLSHPFFSVCRYRTKGKVQRPQLGRENSTADRGRQPNATAQLQGSLGADVGVPVRCGQGPGASGGVSLWEDEPALLQPSDGQQQPGPEHGRVPLQISPPTPESVLGLCICHSQQPFVEHPDMSPDVLYLMEKQPLVIPCRVTHPNVTTTLVKFLPQLHNPSLKPDQMNIIWNSKQGFTIRSPTFYYIGLFFCQTVIGDVTYKSRNYFVHRPVSNIMEVYLNGSGRVQALKGKSLVLNCTATGELNTRVTINWDYPGKVNNDAFIIRRLVKHRTHMEFYSILTIPKLQRTNQGVYTCRVSSGENAKQKEVTVTVYDRPFIRLKPRNESVLEVQAGQKSYRISPKLKAFPAPKVIWLKDGMVAAEQCSRYHMDGNSLVIRDVAEEDAGKYTVLAKIQEYGLYQNLTLTLVVNVSPQIGEKKVSLQDPGSVPRGSRRALHCTSHGVPPPHVQWLWHPCPSKGRPAAPQA